MHNPLFLAFSKGKKGNKRPGTESTARVPKKACTKKHCNLCKKHGGGYTTHITKDCCRYKKDRTEKSSFCTTKKGRKKPHPTKQSLAQLSKKLDKLEKTIKKQSAKGKKHHCSYGDSNLGEEIGLGSIRKVEHNLGETV